jgi:cysteine desulfurase/selenocysteine lyase
MEPYQGGGSMIEDVTIEHTRYKRPPHRFEAGTASIADAIALGEALDYVSRLGLHAIAAYEEELLQYGIEALAKVPGLSLIGTAANKAGILSFTLENIPVQAVGEALDREGIAVRAGHHCAQPVLRRYGREDTVRASLALYNTAEEIDRMAYVLDRLVNG